MLSLFWLSAYYNLLNLACSLRLVPYAWDKRGKRLRKGSPSSWTTFFFHSACNLGFTIFAITRLLHAINKGKGEFPLVQRITNTAWIGVYLLTCLSHYQIYVAECGTRQFVNWVLAYMERRHRKGSLDPVKNILSGKAFIDLKTEEKKTEDKMGYYLFIGLLLWALNPGIHTKLVEEGPCTPHFSSSLFLPCENFGKYSTIPFNDKIPFICVEYYLTTIIFTTFTFNWAVIFLGLAWVVSELKRIKYTIKSGESWNLLAAKYRTSECIMAHINGNFESYLATFPTLLFAVVSVLLFGVIRIWHKNPGTNLMFPLCGARCFYEAVTPLEIAGEMNERNKEVIAKWKRVAGSNSFAGKFGKKLMKKYEASLRGVRCTAGSLYTFENTIVLCCVNNMMQLTLNLLVTFKHAA